MEGGGLLGRWRTWLSFGRRSSNSLRNTCGSPDETAWNVREGYRRGSSGEIAHLRVPPRDRVDDRCSSRGSSTGREQRSGRMRFGDE